jgi:uncharacterized protein YndB with AHSA1/START domain
MTNKAKVTVVPNTSILTIERTFDAPRDKVFKAFTDSDLIAQWWGMSGHADVQENDARDGGAWRLAETFGGNTVTFYGIYHEVSAPERIVQTSEWKELGERGHVILDRTIFTEENGKTHMVITEVYPSVEDLEAMLKSGMETGLQKSYDNLDTVLAKMS